MPDAERRKLLFYQLELAPGDPSRLALDKKLHSDARGRHPPHHRGAAGILAWHRRFTMAVAPHLHPYSIGEGTAVSGGRPTITRRCAVRAGERPALTRPLWRQVSLGPEHPAPSPLARAKWTSEDGDQLPIHAATETSHLTIGRCGQVFSSIIRLSLIVQVLPASQNDESRQRDESFLPSKSGR